MLFCSSPVLQEKKRERQETTGLEKLNQNLCLVEDVGLFLLYSISHTNGLFTWGVCEFLYSVLVQHFSASAIQSRHFLQTIFDVVFFPPPALHEGSLKLLGVKIQPKNDWNKRVCHFLLPKTRPSLRWFRSNIWGSETRAKSASLTCLSCRRNDAQKSYGSLDNFQTIFSTPPKTYILNPNIGGL